MKIEGEVEFQITAAHYDRQLPNTVRYSIATSPVWVPIGRKAITIEGQLDVSGIELTPGTKVKAVFTFIDDEE